MKKDFCNVPFLNEVFDLDKPEDYRTINMFIDENKEAIVKMSLLMAELDKDQRNRANDILQNMSENLKLLTDMRNAVNKAVVTDNQ